MNYYVIESGSGLYYDYTKNNHVRVFGTTLGSAMHYFSITRAKKMCDKIGLGTKVFKVNCLTLKKELVYPISK